MALKKKGKPGASNGNPGNLTGSPYKKAGAKVKEGRLEARGTPGRKPFLRG